jgi:membrane associated rhomboid family serine protease
VHEESDERIVLESADYRDCDEAALVLTARNIAARVDHVDGKWRVYVARQQSAAARAELEQYDREARRARARPRPAVVEVSDGWSGVIVYVMLLLTVAVLVRQDAFGFDWLGAGTLDAARVRDGEWWRSVTALMVHLDLDHLLGNVFFGSFFGHFVARYLGEGIGWAAILGAGALGNFLNALLHPLPHRSIGASTAVFAALGILSALGWRRGVFREAPLRVRLAPVVAGVALLAYTGTGGENTDIFAHLMGFVSGFVAGFGLAYARVPIPGRVQRVAAALAAALIVLSWAAGLKAG